MCLCVIVDVCYVCLLLKFPFFLVGMFPSILYLDLLCSLLFIIVGTHTFDGSFLFLYKIVFFLCFIFKGKRRQREIRNKGICYVFFMVTNKITYALV